MATYTPNYLQSGTYTARMDRQLIESFTLGKEGIVSSASDFVYSLPGSLGFAVTSGSAFVKGDTISTQGTYHVRTTASETVTFSTAHGTLPRVDMVVLRIYDSTEAGGSNNYAKIEIVEGTATSGATLDNRNGAASLPASALHLYDVLIGAAVSSLSASVVRDKRMVYGASRGKSIISSTESTTSTSYTKLTTPDQVQNIVLPTDGLIFVAYQASWRETVNSAARAAIHIGSNQLKVQGGIAASGGAPYTQAARMAAATLNVLRPLVSTPFGLVSINTGATGAWTNDTTTGQAIGVVVNGTDHLTTQEINGATAVSSSNASGVGGPVAIFCTAGTYDISVQFKTSSGTVAVGDRRLWVWTEQF